MQPKRRPSQPISGINVAAFAGVMIVLVYLFMPVHVSEYRGVSADLPKVGHPVSMAHANREDAMVIGITRDNRLFFRADRVSPDDLAARIRDAVKQGAEKEVYIKADARAKYGWVAEVLENVRSAGIEKIGILVDQRRAPTSNP